MPFQKGQSGNPGGRPKGEGRIQDIARKHGEDAIATLAKIMNDNAATTASRVAAASAILDRGYGKPPQFMTGDAEAFKRANEMSDDELARIAAGSSEGAPAKTNGSALPH